MPRHPSVPAHPHREAGAVYLVRLPHALAPALLAQVFRGMAPQPSAPVGHPGATADHPYPGAAR